MKRRELAIAAHLSYPYVSEIENGNKEPSSKALRQLADALRLATSDLAALADRLDGGDEQSLLLSRPDDDRPGRAPAPNDTVFSLYATPPVPGSGPRSDGVIERWVAETAARVARAELERFVADELPGLVRREVARREAEGKL